MVFRPSQIRRHCAYLVVSLVAVSFSACASKTDTKPDEAAAPDADDKKPAAVVQSPPGELPPPKASTTGEVAGLDPLSPTTGQVGDPGPLTDGGRDAGLSNPAIDPEDPVEPKFAPLPPPEGLLRMTRKHEVWLDRENKAVVVHGFICLREGALELFACEVGMKTHESVIAVNAKPMQVHAALLSIGATAGSPVQFSPEYKPASGDEIEILVEWKDKDGNWQKARGQDFVRNAATGKQMKHPWVFGGSGFLRDELTGEEVYLGDTSGDFICVSNFTTATMDIPVESSAQNNVLMYEAFTERIPPRNMPVRMTLKPKLAKKDAASGEPAVGG